jgi:hypothetical protein
VSAYIINGSRWKRSRIQPKAARLAEALRLYPQEKHFSQQLTTSTVVATSLLNRVESR